MKARARRESLLLVLLLGTLLSTPLHSQTAGARIASESINEGSGLVASRTYDGVLWTHNDSGDRARLFAIRSDGQLLAEIEIGGARNVDWEDITADDQGNLYIGDIGNNGSTRRDLGVYVVPEPNPMSDRRARVVRHIRFTYPDQDQPATGRVRNFDSEALFYDSGALYLLTKHRLDKLTKLYRFPAEALAQGGSSSPAVVLELISSFDMAPPDSQPGPDRRAMVTAADLSPDGRTLAVLTYGTITLFDRTEGADFLAQKTPRQIGLVLAVTKQAEAIAWQGDDLLISNEQRDLLRLERAREYDRDLFP